MKTLKPFISVALWNATVCYHFWTTEEVGRKLCKKFAAEFNLTLTISFSPNLGYQGTREELDN